MRKCRQPDDLMSLADCSQSNAQSGQRRARRKGVRGLSSVLLLLQALLLLSTVARPALAKKADKKSAAAAAAAPDYKTRVPGTVERTLPIRSHSLFAPYVDADLQNRWFDFGGTAIVNTNKHIRLTQDRPSQAGWLWSRLPITPTGFEIEFEFRVDGKSNTLFGDGFAVWLTSSRATQGPVFGNEDLWRGLAIFFDTYANSRHSWAFPQILAINNDGTTSYDHGSDGATQSEIRCSIDFRRTDVAAKAKMTYFRNNYFELAIQHRAWDEYETCFVIRNLTLPGSPFLGFTAATGDVSDDHDIVSVSAYNALYHSPSANAPKRSRRSSSSAGSKFLRFVTTLIKWLAILVVIGVAAIAFRGWKTQRNNKRF
ncbi:uncharacterized protein L969DRAFT_621617 [Mixia osmundae IAM 14324]|uniref:L-type lectin-like domain-containing protein n=1 Tax=Mixia osmundae (strain CBS 9802 / IAM 14324 / JCM 22182 / KY 12970) TaxID=764103 RepID=G7E8G3_MIXOS|nr:uncharacterized protein L969DRAFT_621617 [Mixia osmundae IAM 14324]KEI39225.1 hypothetical protein L969DRAFT_621617 [Mixia osmundae IAM 14324]GAA99123.1 hypothetical protein E5Q_05813 [Mixia osmundae IAM 14324]